MDLKQLRYFLAIVEEGSFSKAARRVGVAQPSLSFHVKNMEAELGVTLLQRVPSGVVETEAGAILVQRARLLLADFESLQDDVRRTGSEISGTVRLGLPGTISALLAAPLITRCAAEFPKVKIIVAEAMSGFVKDWLGEGRIDIAVLYEDYAGPEISSQLLLREELVLLVPPKTDCTGKTAIEVMEQVPLVLPSASHGLRKMLDRAFRKKSIELSAFIEVDSYGNIKQLVEDGYGASILPFHAVSREVEEGRLNVLRFADQSIQRGIYLSALKSRRLSRAAVEVEKTLLVLIAELLAEGKWAGGMAGISAPSGT
jgi:LysR family nitrogen assimilation transcriptional regulator